MTTLLNVDRLCVNFGPSRVVDRVSFAIDPHEKFALVGESGSGKSVTALSILRLLETATYEGAIRFEGVDLLAKSERHMRGVRGRDIAMIFQEPMTALNPLYTVGNQIGEVLELHEGLHKNPARGRAIELLARTGIPDPQSKVDAFPHQLSGGQRLIEIWNSIPELLLLIIFASIFAPSLTLLLILLSLFGWISLSDYVRAEFLRNRGLEFVKAARAMGLSNVQIIWRHVLPNSLTPVITFLPFRMSTAILELVSLDFLGLGVPRTVPSLGDLVRQGKANLDSWWIIFPTFALLVTTLLLLTFIGDALRDAFDTRKS